jgi:energy-coupling factor transporter ATP-binding protein EcfA2
MYQILKILTKSTDYFKIIKWEGKMMRKEIEPIIRLAEIKIHQFKNVVDGDIQLIQANQKKYKANILGLYGQNGSGKTALIQAVNLLKFALTGETIPEDFASCIHVEAPCASFEFDFEIQYGDETFKAFYDFSIKREKQTEDDAMRVWSAHDEREKVVLFDECLSYAYQKGEDKKISKGRLVDTRDTHSDYPFVPKTKYKKLFGSGSEMKTDLLVAKKMALQTSRSFIFSEAFFKQLHKRAAHNDNQDFKRHCRLLQFLRRYGMIDLFVIETTNSSAITFNALPIRYKKGDFSKGEIGRFMIPLDRPLLLSEDDYKRFVSVIGNMNIVLKQIVPGLTIGIKDLGPELLKDGRAGQRIELMSQKNEKEIPLKNESEGIIKIISILELLIRVYNDPSTTVAIDELDSGIFEYLLGEMLKIISEKGKGQLIFTSHNLRPLETLDRNFIAFTTTNPKNRFIRLSGIKNNNNLRSSYYRDIALGRGEEELYAPTNDAEIAFAFREAGESDG